MDMLLIPASITIEDGISVQKYKWKSKNKTSIYRRKCKRAFVRVTGSNIVKKLSTKNKINRQVKIKFYKRDSQWRLIINRTANKGLTLQTYFSSHPYLQLILNRNLPKELWKEYELNSQKTYTFPIYIEFNLNEWKDIKLESHDFLPEIEKASKDLMEESLKYGFNVDFVPKGRDYDLELVSPKGNIFILAISSHIAKNESRSKEKRKQKILMDISKMMPVLHNRKVCPVIVSQPLEFEGSWSFTTDKYLNFYKTNFNFKFLTTDFKKGWEKEICNKLLELDLNDKL